MDTAGSNYEGVFHFRLSEECNFIDIKELSGIELQIKDKEAEIKSVVSLIWDSKKQIQKKKLWKLQSLKQKTCGRFGYISRKASWVFPHR
jgi:hypothetical protein